MLYNYVGWYENPFQNKSVVKPTSLFSKSIMSSMNSWKAPWFPIADAPWGKLALRGIPREAKVLGRRRPGQGAGEWTSQLKNKKRKVHRNIYIWKNALLAAIARGGGSDLPWQDILVNSQEDFLLAMKLMNCSLADPSCLEIYIWICLNCFASRRKLFRVVLKKNLRIHVCIYWKLVFIFLVGISSVVY